MSWLVEILHHLKMRADIGFSLVVGKERKPDPLPDYFQKHILFSQVTKTQQQ